MLLKIAVALLLICLISLAFAFIVGPAINTPDDDELDH